MSRTTQKSERRSRLEEERNELKSALVNEFKFFSATNEFREGMLAEIIATMQRYDRIGKSLKKSAGAALPPSGKPVVEIDAPAVEGDTLHFSGE